MAVAGSFVCCNVVILFVCIVLLCVLFEPFKVVGVVVCGVACKDNSKVDRCRDNGVVNRAVNRVVDSLKGWLVGLWIECG